MGKFSIVTRYFIERAERLKLFGVKRVAIALAITLAECLAIAVLLQTLILVFSNHPLIGLVIFAVLFVLVILVFCLVAWKRRKNRKYDNKKEII